MSNSPKSLFAILIIASGLLAFCAPETATQEVAITPQPPPTEAGLTREPEFTREPVATGSPTETVSGPPTETALACLTLLAPVNAADLPLTGRVTFSWTPMAEAGSYILKFVFPSGGTVSFETDQPYRDRYMEAFEAGGEYEWQVSAQRDDGSELCVSEPFTFTKPAFEAEPTGEPD